MRKIVFCLLFTLAGGLHAQQQKVIRVWPGKAPGSEEWTFSERVAEGRDGAKNYSNIVDPTLTVYLPDPARANGTAIIICPGGGMRALSFGPAESAAAYFNGKGIAAFILKYRVVPQTGSAFAPAARPDAASQAAPRSPFGTNELGIGEIRNRRGNANPSPEDQEQLRVIAMAIADGKQAIRLLRRTAAEYHINPNRIGIMGFSAGGGVSIGTALAEAGDAYPDFVALLYGPSLVDVSVPKHGAPLFIAVGNNHFNVTNGCVVLFEMWKEAGRPAEMHVYEQPGGGMTVGNWTDRLYEWLRVRKLVTE